MTSVVPRILFVLKWRESPYQDPYGGYMASAAHSWGDGCGDRQPLSSGLFNSARFMAEMLDDAGIQTKLAHVIDGNDIHREVVAFDATHVIIEAFWTPPYKFDDLGAACPTVKFIVRNHSETPFLASEGIAFGWTAEYLKRPNVSVAPNSLRMLADARFLASQAHPDWTPWELSRRVPYLPNFYPADDLSPHPRKTPDGIFDVGCFGAVRPLKNPLTQAIAAMEMARFLQRPLRFHVNAARVENGGDGVLKNLRAIFEHNPNAELVGHPWSDHDTFRGLVAKMDLTTQAAFTETFSIVAADAVSQNVPTVTSTEVPWSSPNSHADPTRSSSILEAMKRVWHGRFGLVHHNPDLHGLRAFSAESRGLWLAYFGIPDFVRVHAA